jgi:hypothetical protein
LGGLGRGRDKGSGDQLAACERDDGTAAAQERQLTGMGHEVAP